MTDALYPDWSFEIVCRASPIPYDVITFGQGVWHLLEAVNNQSPPNKGGTFSNMHGAMLCLTAMAHLDPASNDSSASLLGVDAPMVPYQIVIGRNEYENSYRHLEACTAWLRAWSF